MKAVLHVVVQALVLSVVCSHVVHLNSSNWKQIFKGEWFIEFYAPWCPACRQFSPIWQELSNENGIEAQIADVDVTESPVLSFVFFVKRLPTLYHVKDGIFRLHDGTRTLHYLKTYLESQKYLSETPIPWYYSPASLHMQIFVRFMDLGVLITSVHQTIVDAGYYPWMSFIIIGTCIIFSGLIIGLVLVLIFDCFLPPRPQILRFFKKTKVSEEAKAVKTEKPFNNTHPNVDASGEHVDMDEYDDTEVRKRLIDDSSDESPELIEK